MVWHSWSANPNQLCVAAGHRGPAHGWSVQCSWFEERLIIMAIIELARANSVAVGLAANTLAIHYAETPSLAAAELVDAAASQALARLDRFSALIVIESSARTPERHVREAMQKTIQRFEAKTDAVAYAILGDGFGSAATRAAVSGILLFVRPSFPCKVFSTVPSALTWLRYRARAKKTLNLQDDSTQLIQFCSRN